MVTSRQPPWVDGEKIPDDCVHDVFRPPPTIPTSFYRSSLVVGARGAGKTTLFRYLKTVHQGIATDISLATQLASITKQTGIGPLAFETPSSIEPMIVGKAISILAISVTSHLLRKGILPHKEHLASCLPKQIRSQLDSLEAADIRSIQAKIASMPLDCFVGLSESQPLKTLVSTLGRTAQKEHGPLLLMFDRADMVPAPALLPVFELLDQSNEHVVLIATRPGLVGRAVENIAEVLVPGDAYSVIQLGAEPRSEQWMDFVQAAVEAQIGSQFSEIPGEIKSWIILLARDSVRWALELFYRYSSAPINNRLETLLSAIRDLQENQLLAAQRTLREYLPDFRSAINDIRREVIESRGSISAPVVISVPRGFPGQLPPVANILDRSMTLGLRIGALSVIEGQRWVPGVKLTEFEIPPLLLWREEDKLFQHLDRTPVVIKRTASSLVHGRRGFGEPTPPSIFVAFRLKFEESQHFRRQIEEAISLYPGLTLVRVTDGIVPVGARWSDVIRDRIRKSRAVIGDVTGMRVDVIFELGFAYGLGKAIIPALSKESDIGLVPRWLGATQIGHFENQAGLTTLAAGLLEHIENPEFQKVPKQPQPVPGLAVWVRNLEWNELARSQFETHGKREGLKIEIMPDDTPVQKIIQRAASASLLVISLDGTEYDALVHFICGAIVAKPTAGYHRTLIRKIFLLQLPSHDGFAADSLLRCENNVLSVQESTVATETAKYGRQYRRWSSTPITSKKKNRSK